MKALQCLIIVHFMLMVKTKNSMDSEYNSDIIELSKKYGYLCECYEVETEDHYLLTVHRIPHGRHKLCKKAPPILIMHGYAGSSIQWLITGPEKSLAFRLADEGYDVWLGNLRGNTYSRKHRYMNPNNMFNNYWDFSFHESGVHDIPATIDFILNNTNQSQLIYIGMSEGTTSFFIMASVKPIYNEKVKLAVALAPAVYMSNPSGLWVQMLIHFESTLKFLMTNFFMKEVPFPRILSKVVKSLCRNESSYQNLCLSVYQFFTLTDSSQINKTLLPLIASNLSGGPVKTLLHYVQISKSDLFRPYDYGIRGNMLHYGKIQPPLYNLSLVKTPTIIFYAKNDFLTNTKDIQKLIKELPNVVMQKLVPYEKFGHTDFCFSVDVNKLVYNDIINFINNFSNSSNSYPKLCQYL